MINDLPRNIGRTAEMVGCTAEEYGEHIEAGEKWCTGCKQWHDRSAFGKDSSRSDGLAGSCRVAKNGHPDHDTPTGRPRGRRRCPRDGDKDQARGWVHHLVAQGLLEPASTQPCSDCGHERSRPGRLHQFDHYLGYAAGHHGDVEVVCTPCHYRREVIRGAHDNAHRTSRSYPLIPTTLGLPASHVAALLRCSPLRVDELIRDGHLVVFPGGTIKLVTVESWRRYLEFEGVSGAAAS